MEYCVVFFCQFLFLVEEKRMELKFLNFYICCRVFNFCISIAVFFIFLLASTFKHLFLN